MGCNWDAKGRARTGTVNGVLEPGEEVCELAVVVFATRSTHRGGRRAVDDAATHGVSPLPESNMVSAGGGALFSRAF